MRGFRQHIGSGGLTGSLKITSGNAEKIDRAVQFELSQSRPF